MTRAAKQHDPTGYRLRVAGHLDLHWSPWFGDLTLTQDDDGTTSLVGVVTDQAQLHGLLTKIRDLGVTLLSVETLVPPRSVDDDAGSHPGTRPPAKPAQKILRGDSSQLQVKTAGEILQCGKAAL